VEPAQALADLTEISSQLESAVLAGPDGSVVASTLADDERAGVIAANAVALLEGARDTGNGARAPTQVQAATREGCVFVVRDERHVLAAVTGPDPTAGLVFYDLKTTLRMVDEAERPKRPRPAEKRDDEGEPADA
jgi:predicted regulator of Ras-like GTPase activity (Roadblock/LC7/MglB family)